MFAFGAGRRRSLALHPPRGISQHLQSLARRRRSQLVGQAYRRKFSNLSGAAAEAGDPSSSSSCAASMAWTWRQISLALCVFGFLREIRPSEPFVTDFMIEPWRNVTADDVNRYVFPVGTYSYAAQLVIVFLLTDYLRYKPLIIASGLAGCVVWSLLIWTRSLAQLQLVECFYGTYMATEVAYYTYIYAKVDRQHYTTVTSHTRAAILAGRFVAGTVGQLLVYVRAMDYLQLNYITLAAQAASTVWALCLPAVRTSVYFHRPLRGDATVLVRTPDDDDAIDERFYAPKPLSPLNCEAMTDAEAGPDDLMRTGVPAEPPPPQPMPTTERSFPLLWSQFCRAYSSADVLIWSLWYAVGMCGYLQAISYIQVLWTAIDGRPDQVIWNGAVEAVNTLLGAAVALLAGHLRSEWLTRAQLLWSLVALSVCQGGAIVAASQTAVRTVSYVAYAVFYVLYSFTITVASAEVAKHLEDDSYGLVFGVNTLAALLLQSVLTLAVVADGGLALTVVGQYAVLAGYFFVLAGVFVVAIAVGWWRSGPDGRSGV